MSRGTSGLKFRIFFIIFIIFAGLFLYSLRPVNDWTKTLAGVDAVLLILFCLGPQSGECARANIEVLRYPTPKCASASDHRHLLAEEVKATPARSRRSLRRRGKQYRRCQSVPRACRSRRRCSPPRLCTPHISSSLSPDLSPRTTR